tara:strand:+ start:529 stop:660 length:132 start_codon:yes stop_codon:yes gene_type:complete
MQSVLRVCETIMFKYAEDMGKYKFWTLDKLIEVGLVAKKLIAH